MPAIGEDSDSGNGGVSAEGFGARAPRRRLAELPPSAPAASRLSPFEPLPRALPRLRSPPRREELLPCELWPLTCGVGDPDGAPGGGAGALSTAGGAGVVAPGDSTGGAGAGVVAVELASAGEVIASVVVGVVASSAANELAGNSAAANAQSVNGRSRSRGGRERIDQLPSR